jgi:transposase
METIHVVTEVQRRRRFSVEQKIRCVQETNQPGISVSHIARKYGISPSLLFLWRNRMAEGGKKAIAVDDEVVAAAEVKELKQRIRELERVLGKKTLENEILKDAVDLARQKKLISQLPLLPEDDTL